MECPVCRKQTCDCVLNNRELLLRRIGKAMSRLPGGKMATLSPSRGGKGENNYACTAIDDAHTNGPTRGIVSAPLWIVEGAEHLIGGQFQGMPSTVKNQFGIDA